MPIQTASPGFELVAELAAFTSGPARASLDAGKSWIRAVRRLAGVELIERVERYTLGMYVELATVGLKAAPPRGPDELITMIDAFDPAAFQRRLLGADSQLNRTMVRDGAFEGAIAGDREAREEVRSALGADRANGLAIDRLLGTEPKLLKAEFLAIIGDWADRVFPHFSPEAVAAIERDRIAKEDLLDRSPRQAVLTAATNGVTFTPSPWVGEIVILPTVALRPFIVPTEVERTAVFVCSVADEALDLDPAAPPRRLVKMAAALGDELRMRVLHVLRDADLTATEIAERLGVERTSLHHHLGILRSAGLLAIRDEGERGWRYALRDEGLRGVGTGLGSPIFSRVIGPTRRPEIFGAAFLVAHYLTCPPRVQINGRALTRGRIVRPTVGLVIRYSLGPHPRSHSPRRSARSLR